MKKSPKNYIYFKGGSWGDITGLIVNNNVQIDKDIQNNLKKTKSNIGKNLFDKLDVHTLVGHALNVLDYGYTNYQIIITDAKIKNIASNRFATVNNLNDISSVLKDYYPITLHKEIESLPLKKQISLLSRKYEYDKKIDAIPIDISCIFQKQKYIDMLSAKFSFDKKIAYVTYDNWYAKQTFLPED
jgi:hypothetical protein